MRNKLCVLRIRNISGREQRIGVWHRKVMANSSRVSGRAIESTARAVTALSTASSTPTSSSISFDGTLGALLLVSATLPLAGALCSSRIRDSHQKGYGWNRKLIGKPSTGRSDQER